MKNTGEVITDFVHMFSMVFTVAVFGFFAVNVQNTLILKDFVSPVPGLTVEEWQDLFDYFAAYIVVGGAGAMAIIWYLYARFATKITMGMDANRRNSWGIGMAVTLVFVLFGIYQLYKVTIDGLWLVISFIVFNGFGTYYCCTALFAPNSLKYTAPLSVRLRRW